jgi:hypothetical protein
MPPERRVRIASIALATRRFLPFDMARSVTAQQAWRHPLRDPRLHAKKQKEVLRKQSGSRREDRYGDGVHP